MGGWPKGEERRERKPGVYAGEWRAREAAEGGGKKGAKAGDAATDFLIDSHFKKYQDLIVLMQTKHAGTLIVYFFHR